MNGMPSVVVRKNSALSALFSGFFGLLIVLVLSVAGLGFYGLHVVDGRVSEVFALGGTVVENLPKWLKSLPPVLTDAVDDQRAPEYRDEIEYSVRLAGGPDDRGYMSAVVVVTNNGDRAISLMALNVVLEDEDGTPIRDFRAYVATPLALAEPDWRGPLLPGSTRKFATRVHTRSETPLGGVSAEISELRVFNPVAHDQIAGVLP